MTPTDLLTVDPDKLIDTVRAIVPGATPLEVTTIVHALRLVACIIEQVTEREGDG